MSERPESRFAKSVWLGSLLVFACAGSTWAQGNITFQAVLQTNDELPEAYEVSTLRYIVEATPGMVGEVLELDHDIVESLCRDKDGCDVTLQMVNWDGPGQPGSVASRTARLFLSETSGWWRMADTDLTAIDDDDNTNDWFYGDCYFTDAETYGASANTRLDSAPGWGLLNVAGGSFSDANTTCRVVLTD